MPTDPRTMSVSALKTVTEKVEVSATMPMGGNTVTCAVPILVGSATLTALTVTGFGLGTVLGAVYRPVTEMVPTVALPPSTSFTNQVTAVLSPPGATTVAVNCCVCPTSTVAVWGVTVTVIPPGPGPTVTCAVSLLLG